MTNTLVNDNKAVVYAKLWDDWRLRTEKDKREKTGARHRANSRIYSMFKDRKDRKAKQLALDPKEIKRQLTEKKIGDKYILLKAAHDACLLYEQLDEDTYIEVLCELIRDSGKLPVKFKKKLDSGVGADELEKDFDKLASALLRGCITDDFRNNGYSIRYEPAKNGEGKELIEIRPDITPSFEGQSSEGESSERQQGAEADLFSDEFIRRVSVMYNSVTKAGLTECFLPLHIDQSSGAGLYLIGRALFRKSELRQVCYPCVMWFSTMSREEEIDDGLSSFNLSMDTSRYPDLISALKAYRSLLNGSKRYEGYKGVNGVLPRDTDDFYKAFFDEVEERFAEETAAEKSEATALERKVMEEYAKQEEAAKASAKTSPNATVTEALKNSRSYGTKGLKKHI